MSSQQNRFVSSTKLILSVFFLCVFAGCSKPCFKEANSIDQFIQCAINTDADDKRAFKLFLNEAEQGKAESQFKLSWLYEQGKGVAQDDAKAVEWLSKSAAQGYASAQYSLGVRYEQGKGVALDNQKAFDLYSKAAEQGNADAQYNLGMMFHDGKSVPQNYEQAMAWFSKAGKQGHVVAQYILGDMNLELKENAKAFTWYSEAAERGFAPAQFKVGMMYQQGTSVTQDDVLGYLWFNLAATQNFPDAAKSKDDLAKKMTPDQINKAQQLTTDWLAKHTSK